MATTWPKALMEGPSIAPPPGFMVDFENPENLANVDYALAGISIVLSTLIVGLRLYSKKYVTKSCSADDFVLLAGWAAFMVFCAFVALMAHDGIARHQWNIRLYEMEKILLHLFIDSAIYCVVTALIKAAIFLQFLKIFSPSKIRGPMFWSCWGFLIFFSVFYLAVMLAGIFICNPVQKYWILWLPGGHCAKRRSIPIISASANIAADVVIILLPQRAIWQLNMSLERKLRVSLIFGVGLLALGASAARLHYTLLMVDSADVTWNVNNMGLWTLVEIVITIACSSAPSLHALAKTSKNSSTWTALSSKGFGCCMCMLRSRKKHPSSEVYSGDGSLKTIGVHGDTQRLQPLFHAGTEEEGLMTTREKPSSSYGRQDSWLRQPPAGKYMSARAYEVV